MPATFQFSLLFRPQLETQLPQDFAALLEGGGQSSPSVSPQC